MVRLRTLYLLVKHPSDLARLERELDEAGLLVTAANPRPRPFTYADIGKLRWLDCCMRVRPAALHPTTTACRSLCKRKLLAMLCAIDVCPMIPSLS